MRHAQRSTASFAGRHERLLDDLAHALRHVERPRVLSFGCAAGFEVIDLARHIPHATVLGCDVAEKALGVARERCVGHKVFVSTYEALREHGPFDAITVLNVLCRYPPPDPDDLGDAFSFEQFEGTLTVLADVLADAGVLALYNAQYALEDTVAAGLFAPIPARRHPRNGWLEKYDRNSRRRTIVDGEWRGAWLPLREWRQAIHADLTELTDLSVVEDAPYTHRPVGSAGLPDLEVTLWRRISRRTAG